MSYNVGALGTTYRFYVNAEDATDKFSAHVFGNNEATLVINTRSDGIYNDAFNIGMPLASMNCAFGFFPDLEFDSYATIGLDGPAAGVPGANDPSLVQDAALTPTVSGYFTVGELASNHHHWAFLVRVEHGGQCPSHGSRWSVAQMDNDLDPFQGP